VLDAVRLLRTAPRAGQPAIEVSEGERLMLARRLAVRLEEQLLIRVHAATRPGPWVSLYRTLSLPLLLRGDRVQHRALLGGRSWSVVCCGRPKRFQWLLSQLFDDVSPAATLPAAATIDPAPFRHPAADLTAVEIHPTVATRFRDAGWIIVPESVRWNRAVGDPSLSAHGRAARSLRSDLGLIRRHGYTMEESWSRADWLDFCEHMLLPYSRGRFGEAAWEPSPGFLRELGSRAHLLYAVRGGRRLAALCVVPAGPRVWAPMLGVRSGCGDPLREGTIAALYKFVLSWAAERGALTVDGGRTRPSLSDSIAWYKAKWGFQPVPDPLSHLVALKFGAGTATIQARLASRRILLERSEGVSAVANAEAPPTASRSSALTVAPGAQED
jgi:hypothetical protein